MSNQHCRRVALAAAAVLSLAACAGTKVHGLTRSSAAAVMDAPHRVCVLIEDESPIPTRPSHRANHVADVEAAKTALTEALGKLLTARGLELVPEGQAADLLLHARLEDVRSGKEILRLTVGYGAGKAVLDTVWSLTELREPGHPQLLSFETRSTSGAMPGAGVGLAAGAPGDAVTLARSSLTATGTLRQGVPREVNQTSGKVDTELKKYFSSRHWAYGNS
jgi:uncharacterized protein DUF4410